MISTFTAFFDANVFYGARLRSLIVTLAETKLFRARWSERVQDEWARHLLENRPDLNPESLMKTKELMVEAVPDCLVTGFEPLMAGIVLPDPNDAHVVAAAVMTRASTIVTFNLKDFPAEIITAYRLHAKHPDDFLLDAAEIAPTIFLNAIKEDWGHYRRPPLSFEDYTASLSKAGVPRTAQYIQQFKVLLCT